MELLDVRGGRIARQEANRLRLFDRPRPPNPHDCPTPPVDARVQAMLGLLMNLGLTIGLIASEASLHSTATLGPSLLPVLLIATAAFKFVYSAFALRDPAV